MTKVFPILLLTLSSCAQASETVLICDEVKAMVDVFTTLHKHAKEGDHTLLLRHDYSDDLSATVGLFDAIRRHSAAPIIDTRLDGYWQSFLAGLSDLPQHVPRHLLLDEELLVFARLGQREAMNSAFHYLGVKATYFEGSCK